MNGKHLQKNILTDQGDRFLPVVALVGRPNVGKSTLFNRLTHSRRAIIEATPGMTRDRLYGTIHREQGSFRLVDTGGIEERPDLIAQMIREQAHRAIEEAAVIIFLTDGREGVLAGDLEIAAALRQTNKPVILFVNKMEDRDPGLIDGELYRLGLGQPIMGSGEHKRNIEDLLDAIDKSLEGSWRTPRQSESESVIKLAIVGRPNVGKSSIVNRLLNEERVMVSDVAGTTRDPIDSYLQYQKHTFCLVDTAGIRKRGKIEGSQESLSVMMAKRQVENADVVVLMVDATDFEAAQDAAVAGIADSAFKPVIVAVNKWDMVEDKETNTPKKFEDRIRRRLKFLESSPFLFLSAKTGQRVTKILDLAIDVHQRMSTRVTTGILNRFVEDLAKNHRMPSHARRLVKVYYMTQVETHPPTFVMMVKSKDPLHFTQERFFINRIRETFDLNGIPIRLVVKPH